MTDPLVELRNVRREFGSDGRQLVAVDDLSMTIQSGEIVTLVGESGSGKTTTGRLIAGLIAPTSGEVLFRGAEVRSLRGAARREYRLGVQLIHQDPFASLNPTQRVGDILGTPLRRHRVDPVSYGIGMPVDASRPSAVDVQSRAAGLLEAVDLVPARDFLDKFPHQLSGGQRQRVAVARALTVGPKLIVADESVSMVNVSIRLSLLDMIRRLRERVGLAVLLITHDLALARYIGNDGQMIVMHRGRVVEAGPTAAVLESPRAEYTAALLAAAAPRHARSDTTRPPPVDRDGPPVAPNLME